MSQEWKAFAKINPYRYPTKKHKRQQSPYPYKNYQSFKPYLRLEFGGRCVYCLKSDFNQDPSVFHVEHYRPKNSHPELETTYTNLYYSCAACNRRKNKYWSDDALKRIVNPCDHVMSTHLKFVDAKIGHNTDQGKRNIEILGLNEEDTRGFRENEREILVLLISGIISKRGSRDSKDVNWLARAVTKVSQMTNLSEDKICSVCKV